MLVAPPKEPLTDPIVRSLLQILPPEGWAPGLLTRSLEQRAASPSPALISAPELPFPVPLRRVLSLSCRA